jgi:hypothetical protein
MNFHHLQEGKLLQNSGKDRYEVAQNEGLGWEENLQAKMD